MLDHVSLGTHDLTRSTEFYAAVLAPLDYRIQVQNEKEVGFGIGDEWTFFLYPAAIDAALIGARTHIAFRAKARAAIIAAHAIALVHGGRALADRAPAERPQFGADYFGCTFTDPDGHAIELMTRAGAGNSA
jgi:catechol 2,3-dioxygenase-like lactoylglutathione lyase family enzyme